MTLKLEDYFEWVFDNISKITLNSSKVEIQNWVGRIESLETIFPDLEEQKILLRMLKNFKVEKDMLFDDKIDSLEQLRKFLGKLFGPYRPIEMFIPLILNMSKKFSETYAQFGMRMYGEFVSFKFYLRYNYSASELKPYTEFVEKSCIRIFTRKIADPNILAHFKPTNSLGTTVCQVRHIENFLFGFGSFDSIREMYEETKSNLTTMPKNSLKRNNKKCTGNSSNFCKKISNSYEEKNLSTSKRIEDKICIFHNEKFVLNNLFRTEPSINNVLDTTRESEFLVKLFAEKNSNVFDVENLNILFRISKTKNNSIFEIYKRENYVFTKLFDEIVLPSENLEKKIEKSEAPKLDSYISKKIIANFSVNIFLRVVFIFAFLHEIIYMNVLRKIPHSRLDISKWKCPMRKVNVYGNPLQPRHSKISVNIWYKNIFNRNKQEIDVKYIVKKVQYSMNLLLKYLKIIRVTKISRNAIFKLHFSNFIHKNHNFLFVFSNFCN